MVLSLRLPFSARGQAGVVSVEVSENLDPAGVGSSPAASGFPTCRATVEFEASGYLAMLGWVQNVGETTPVGSDLEWALDPFVLFEGIATPYAIYGARPELFDAPYRSDRSLSLDWVAPSFLCVAPSSPFAREVEAVVGFSWGFKMHDGDIHVADLAPLTKNDWSAQVNLLSSAYPSWQFLTDHEW